MPYLTGLFLIIFIGVDCLSSIPLVSLIGFNWFYEFKELLQNTTCIFYPPLKIISKYDYKQQFTNKTTSKAIAPIDPKITSIKFLSM